MVLSLEDPIHTHTHTPSHLKTGAFLLQTVDTRDWGGVGREECKEGGGTYLIIPQKQDIVYLHIFELSRAKGGKHQFQFIIEEGVYVGATYCASLPESRYVTHIHNQNLTEKLILI